MYERMFRKRERSMKGAGHARLGNDRCGLPRHHAGGVGAAHLQCAAPRIASNASIRCDHCDGLRLVGPLRSYEPRRQETEAIH